MSAHALCAVPTWVDGARVGAYDAEYSGLGLSRYKPSLITACSLRSLSHVGPALRPLPVRGVDVLDTPPGFRQCGFGAAGVETRVPVVAADHPHLAMLQAEWASACRRAAPMIPTVEW